MAVRRRNVRRETRLAFEALMIEGGLLSPEWLSRVAQLDAGQQTEADYRIPKGLNLRDEIGRSWRIAQAHWADFAVGSAAAAGSAASAERFARALLVEVFGFVSLEKAATSIIDDRSYPIGFAAIDGRVPVVVAPARSGLDTPSTAFGDSGRRRSAFGLAQEYLNAHDPSLWGIVTDGATLRILRDNASLTRPAWVEADLERMFIEERYPDFAALWLLVHETRFGRADQPVTECALETWRDDGRKEGTRAREHLRRGVEDALVALGNGFLSHPENTALRADLQGGALTPGDYFNQLLRLVYRLIFLLTVEERNLLHPDVAGDAAKTLYAKGYSLRRLRERSVKRSAHDRHADLWEATKIVFRGVAAGEPRLGLPALAGLFAKDQCPALDARRLENRALLLAVFKLAWLREEGSLARVNWRDMGPEELGSVYESLLELVPQIAGDGRRFAFATGGETKGNARKTSGSYYTPDSLVQVLLDSALEPVIADTIARNAEAPVEALLGLSIVDPACGSGHFLLAAARRLASHVARLRANGTPSAAEYRHALREVIGRCIYGVDLNPMAVELCKVSLWMEAVEPGLPLTFLNSHVQHGNALLGTTPELMAKGIPDKAWDPIEGDDRKVASALKKRNKAEAAGQRTFASLWVEEDDAEAQSVARAMADLEAATDESAEGLAEKESQWDGILESSAFRHQKLVADAWCAAFVWPKQPGELMQAAPTNELWRQIRDGQKPPPALTETTVNDLALQYRFFHWHLQFPQVFAKGGFDVVLGNPPWVRQELLKHEKPLLTQYSAYTGTADSSVYFLEKGIRIARVSGFVAMLTPNKWFRAAYASELRSFVRKRCRVGLVVDFGHSRTLFADADTFPALIALRPVVSPVPDDELTVFVRAHDSDLAGQTLRDRINVGRISVAHGSLGGEQWQLEDTAVAGLLNRLLRTGRPLEEEVRRPILRGILTGFNEAFYVDTQTRDALVAFDPRCEPLFRKLLRGRDIRRWMPQWSQMWHIVIPSSQNKIWPWSASVTEVSAEEIFEQTYPTVHRHLKNFESRLRARQDRGTFWWELRSCDYYDALAAPKIVVQCIAYYSRFALDADAHVVNNKVLVVPSDDLYVLSVLNSRIAWWVINRTFQHMKDEGISVDVQFLKKLPMPTASSSLREEIRAVAGRLISASSGAPMDALERQLDTLVNQAFDLTEEEQRLLVENLPLRDPIDCLKHDPDEGSLDTLLVSVEPALRPTPADPRVAHSDTRPAAGKKAPQ